MLNQKQEETKEEKYLDDRITSLFSLALNDPLGTVPSSTQGLGRNDIRIFDVSRRYQKLEKKRRKPKCHIKMEQQRVPFIFLSLSLRPRENEAARGRGTRTQGIHLPALAAAGRFSENDAINKKKKKGKKKKKKGWRSCNLTESR